MAIKDEDKLKVSRRVASIWVVISLAIAVFIGVMGVSVSERGIIPVYANNSEAERIIVHMAKAISNHGILPALVGGLILAGILASTMSTADSQLLAASSSVSHNIFRDCSILNGQKNAGNNCKNIGCFNCGCSRIYCKKS